MAGVPPRRAQTYDNYPIPTPSLPGSGNEGMGRGVDMGPSVHGGASRSGSVRDFDQPLDLPELDMSDPPAPPAYSALMASEAAAAAAAVGGGGQMTYEPLTMTMPAPTVRSSEHPPYAPVDYPSQLPYDRPVPAQHHRLSSGSVASLGRGRPRSDPHELESDLANLRLTTTSPSPTLNSNPQHIARQHTLPASHFPAPYRSGPGPGPAPPPRQRSVTGGYPSRDDGAASVYSLDSGMGAYGVAPGPPVVQRGYGFTPTPLTSGPGPVPTGAVQSAQAQGPPQAWLNQSAFPLPDFANPYYTAANDFVGLPPGAPGPQPTAPMPPQPTRQGSTTTLARTNTTASSLSVNSLSRVALTESVGASSTRRSGSRAAIDVSKPPFTREFVDDYRNRMKVDPDPEAQFAFTKYLIEAAKKIGDEMGRSDPRAARKYRDSLLTESLRNVKKLAEGKEPYADAQFFLANLYGTGQLGLQVDHEKAYYLYLMASKLNHPAATYRAAVCCELGAGTKRDANRAVLFYRKAAALGDTAAMYKLALILLNGLMGHPKNPRESLVWLRRAASQADEDNPHALHELALLHERANNGTNGVIPHDPHLAREYLVQAAQLNYPPAQFKLGSCHEFGTLGFPIDPRRSIAWYTRAAERGESEAELALSGWYLTGSEGVLKQSDTEAYLWGRKAANKGLAKAEYAVGYYTEIGIGVKQDIELAKRWYMRAASQNNKRAMQRLAELNSNRNVKGGKGARPTRKEAESECTVM